MSRYVLTKPAAQDLHSIFDQICEHRPETAYRVVERLRDRFRLLADYPLLGQMRPDLGIDYRAFAAERWIVFYRPIHDGIEVLRVLDGARDIGGLSGKPN